MTEIIKKTSPMKTEETATSLSNAPPLLLLIEDTPLALLGLESIVKKAGYRFKSAVDGEQGLELVKENDFDLIITDIGLPGLSGIEVTKQIRDWEKVHYRKKTPIIALSAHAAHLTESECRQAGMDKVFAKPANIDMVQSVVRQFILGHV